MNFKLTYLLLGLALLTSCAGFNIDDAIGVAPDENAVLCATADIDPTWSESTVHYKRIELPASFEVTPEQMAALIKACDE